MKISSVHGREIYDSRGNPTIECEITLSNGQSVRASVPSGISRGEGEAFELRDGGERLNGLGVLQAIEHVEKKIAPLLVGRPPHFVETDLAMIELDGTDHKSRLGANAMLAVSMAACKANALSENVPLYEFMAGVCDYQTVTFPCPMFNMISGGAHSRNDLPIQEMLVTPHGVDNFRQAMEYGSILHHCLQDILCSRGINTNVNVEGSFMPQEIDQKEAFDLLMHAIEIVEQQQGISAVISLDCAASQWYDPRAQMYKIGSKYLESQEVIQWYEQLIAMYPIFAIEDGLSEHDWDGWKYMTQVLGQRIRLAADDLLVGSHERIWQAVKDNIADIVIIKPNQIGTVTETLQSVKISKEHGYDVIVSHRSCETNDSFIADLAVGTSALFIKAGGFSRGERMAKYNRILRIEDALRQHAEPVV